MAPAVVKMVAMPDAFEANWMMFVISASMMATWMPWNMATRPPGTWPAATPKIAPTRMGQHQLPTMA